MNWLLLSKLLGSIGGIVGSFVNARNAKKNNALQMQLTQQANAMQVAESEKEYERSKAGNQVGLMMQAGMSRAGAINALNGGGSYTPASINTSQVQAPHLDTSVFQSIMSNAQQAENVDKQIQAQMEMQERELDFQREKWNQENNRANAAAAREKYNHDLSKLDRKKQDAAAAITSMADPADYDTPAAYRKALYLKASPVQRKYFNDSVFCNAIDLYHAANAAAKNTAARTSNVEASTASVISATEIAKATSILQAEKHSKEMALLQQQFDHNSTMYKLLESKTQDEISAIAKRLQYDSSEHALKMARAELELCFGIPLEQARDELERDIKSNSFMTVGLSQRDYRDAYKTYVEQAQVIVDKIIQDEK